MRKRLIVLALAVLALSGCQYEWQEYLTFRPGLISPNGNCTVWNSSGQSGWIQVTMTNATTNGFGGTITAFTTPMIGGNSGFCFSPTVWRNGSAGWQSAANIYPGEVWSPNVQRRDTWRQETQTSS